MVENKQVPPLGPTHITSEGSPSRGETTSANPTGAAFAFGTSSTEQGHDTNIKRLLALVAEYEYADIRNRIEIINLGIHENPSWSILLHLYVEHTKNKTSSILSMTLEYKGMQSTALRWINILAEQGLISISKLNSNILKNRSTLTQNGIDNIENYLKTKLSYIKEISAFMNLVDISTSG